MALPAYITWTVNPEIFPDILPVRWYGLLFATAFLFGYYILNKIFKKEGVKTEWLESVLLYVMVGTVIGARMGHVLFYDFEDYWNDPLEIFKIWNGGLASHGAAIGVLIAVYFYSKKVTKKGMFWTLDRIVIPIMAGAIFVRTGNLMNHEIIGEPSDLPWAFLFTRSYENSQIPVHPAQLYEALCYLISFVIMWVIYQKTNASKKPGMVFGLFLVLLWTARFFVEFVKHSQGGFEEYLGDALSTGQWLSIPFVLAGIWFMVRAKEEKSTPSRA